MTNTENKKELLQTWRWFGPNDPVPLSHIKQAGVQGIVTALHHVPHGEVWTKDEIVKRQNELKAEDFEWSVVESLTVHEDIKTRSGKYKEYLENYRISLKNLADCGIKTVTYNFMPVNDWTRTDIDYPMQNGARALYFNWVDLAVFDVHLLKRKNAEDDYSVEILQKAEEKFASMSEAEKEKLCATVMFGIPGEKKATLDSMRAKLENYSEIDAKVLKENLAYFLKEVAPTAAECGIKLAIHPDDPPCDIFGLPRIVSTQKDLLDIVSFAEEESNGICFCTGSLGASPNNNLPEMIEELGTRVHFVHLRNVKRDEEGNFYESDHLDGEVDMYRVMTECLKIQQKVETPLPFRPDHGHQMLDDLGKVTNPGYSAIGRLRGLAELRGLQMGILRSLSVN
ncbi:MAG TPA: mannonate dehydratase [Pyrinomonadaceae bacterium]|nr:mannonate dehydratase [Pyrinomonadaceae bacterium]